MSLDKLHEKAELQHDKISQEIFEVLSADIDNLPELKNIVEKTELGLKDVLGDDNLIVSKRTKTIIDKIGNRYNSNEIYNELETQRSDAETKKNDAAAIADDESKKSDIRADNRRIRDQYEAVEKKYENAKNHLGEAFTVWTISDSRSNEYYIINDCFDKFKDIEETEQKISWISIGASDTRDINPLRSLTNWDFSQNTKLLNIDGSKVQQINANTFKIKLKNKEWNIQEYVFDKMELEQTATGSEIKLKFDTGFKIYKSDGKTIADDLDLKNIAFGFETAISHTDLKQKVAQRQTLKLELNLPVSDAQKEVEIRTMETPIKNNLTALYKSSFKELRREAVTEVIRSRGLHEFEQLSDKEKDECIKLLPITLSANEAKKFDGANSFITYMKAKKDDMSYCYSTADYRSYLTSHIQENIRAFMKEKMKNTISMTFNETQNKGKIISFLWNLEKSKTDNADARIGASSFMNTHIDTIINEMKKDNYMRFYSNEKYDISGQKVNINGEWGKTFDYDMQLKVLSPTSFMLDLTIDGVKKSYSANSHYELVNSILWEYEIASDKWRLHIAYNIYKAMLGIAQKRGLKLSRIEWDRRRTLLLENWNIKATNWKLRSNKTSDYKNLFDEQAFQASSNMNDYKSGLRKLANEFHTLNQSEWKHHRKATKWKWVLNRHRFAAKKLPARWYFSPIKFLLNKNKNLNFDFDTSITIPSIEEGGEERSINIKFERDKFILKEGEQTFSGFDLRRILRKPQFVNEDKRIYWVVYKELVKKLRTNTTIKNRSYYAIDETGDKTYIINANGQVGYVPRENKEIWNKNIRGKVKKSWIINWQVHAMRILDNPDELYQDAYLMNKIIKSMNRSLRGGAFTDLLPNWMKSQKLKRAA